MRLSTVQPIRAGGVIIRDLRAYHGGTPNLSENVRAIPVPTPPTPPLSLLKYRAHPLLLFGKARHLSVMRCVQHFWCSLLRDGGSNRMWSSMPPGFGTKGGCSGPCPSSNVSVYAVYISIYRWHSTMLVPVRERCILQINGALCSLVRYLGLPRQSTCTYSPCDVSIAIMQYSKCTGLDHSRWCYTLAGSELSEVRVRRSLTRRQESMVTSLSAVSSP